VLVDIGVNLTSSRFEKDLDVVLQRAVSAQIEQMVVTGTSIIESVRAAELSAKYPARLFSTAGIHPHNAKEFTAESVNELSSLLERKQVVAVGECGLDFNRNFSPAEDQLVCFEAQLKLAVDKHMPVFLHQRDAHKEFVEILSRYVEKLPAAVAHCFTGNEAELLSYLEMGLYIGVTGWICDERRGGELQRIVNKIPLDRLMIETDAPYLIPRGLKPKPKSNRNEPSYLPHICQTVAECYGLSFAEIETYTYKNSRNFFALDKMQL